MQHIAAAVCAGAQSLRLLIVTGFPGASPIFGSVAHLTVELLSLLLLASRAETAVEGDVARAAGHAFRQGACTGWFPAVVTGSPVSVPKRPSSCENLVGADGFEPPASRL